MNRLLTLVFATITTLLPACAQEASEDLLMHDLISGNVKRYVKLDGELAGHNPKSKDLNVSWVYFDNEGRLIRDAIWKAYVYDQNGRYTRGQFTHAIIDRNERGHISHETSGDICEFDATYDNNYTYTQYGKKETENYNTNFSNGTITYKYGPDNELVSSHTEYVAEGNEGTIDHTYTITKRDRHGNWIERKLHYKQVESPYDNPQEKETSEYDQTECRIIEYYAPGEKSVDAQRFIIPVTVTGTNVRLRLGPSTTHQIYTKSGKTVYPPKGAKLRYLGETDDFFFVEYQKARVYISKQFSERTITDFLMN